MASTKRQEDTILSLLMEIIRSCGIEIRQIKLSHIFLLSPRMKTWTISLSVSSTVKSIISFLILLQTYITLIEPTSRLSNTTIQQSYRNRMCERKDYCLEFGNASLELILSLLFSNSKLCMLSPLGTKVLRSCMKTTSARSNSFMR